MNIELKDASHGPAYAQVRDQIDVLIRSGAITSGETLTAPNALARKLSIDKGEVVRAYFELELSGLVKKETSKDFLGQPKTVYRVR
jgi:DNA-binding transcriptional regulator YhcF (GntR family)